MEYSSKDKYLQSFQILVSFSEQSFSFKKVWEGEKNPKLMILHVCIIWHLYVYQIKYSGMLEQYLLTQFWELI